MVMIDGLAMGVSPRVLSANRLFAVAWWPELGSCLKYGMPQSLLSSGCSCTDMKCTNLRLGAGGDLQHKIIMDTRSPILGSLENCGFRCEC